MILKREIEVTNLTLSFFKHAMQDDEKGKYANARYMLPSGSPSPQAGLLTGWRVIPVVLVECLSILILLPKQFHVGFMICLLLCVIFFVVLNMLSEGSVGLLCPVINVVDSDVDVVYPLREITITSS